MFWGKSDEIKRQYFELVTTKTSLFRIPRITQTSTRYNMDTGVPFSAGIRPQPLLLFMIVSKDNQLKLSLDAFYPPA